MSTYTDSTDADRITTIEVSAWKWHQPTYGNTYHVAAVDVRLDDGTWHCIGTSDVRYGYGRHYEHTAGTIIIVNAPGLAARLDLRGNRGPSTSDDAYAFGYTTVTRAGIEWREHVHDDQLKRDLNDQVRWADDIVTYGDYLKLRKDNERTSA